MERAFEHWVPVGERGEDGAYFTARSHGWATYLAIFRLVTTRLAFIFHGSLDYHRDVSFSKLYTPKSYSAVSSTVTQACYDGYPSQTVSTVFGSGTAPLYYIPSGSPKPHGFGSTSTVSGPSFIHAVVSDHLQMSSIDLWFIAEVRWS